MSKAGTLPTAAGDAAKLEWLSSRHGEHMDDGPRLTEFCIVGRQAATALRTLEAEVARLKEEKDRLGRTFHALHESVVREQMNRANAAEAREKVLREALETIRERSGPIKSKSATLYDIDRIVDAALSPKEPS